MSWGEQYASRLLTVAQQARRRCAHRLPFVVANVSVAVEVRLRKSPAHDLVDLLAGQQDTTGKVKLQEVSGR